MTTATTEVEQRETNIIRMVETQLSEPITVLPQSFRELIARAARHPEAIEQIHAAISNRMMTREA